MHQVRGGVAYAGRASRSCSPATTGYRGFHQLQAFCRNVRHCQLPQTQHGQLPELCLVER